LSRKVLPGRPYPLGATWDGRSVNFALFSEHATEVELCLFDGPNAEQDERIRLRETTGFIRHACIEGLQPGQVYGYRVKGPYEPEHGHRFNSSKLLVDPYAKALVGGVDWGGPVFGYEVGHHDADLSFSSADSARAVPKCIVVDESYDWEGDVLPQIPLHRSIIYEVHVRGFTKRHPGVPEELRGTYAGMAHPAAIEHLQRLGVTAVELLPVHEIADEGTCSTRGCATTGATTRSTSSRRRFALRSSGRAGRTRSASSRRW
jgi:isoamylase